MRGTLKNQIALIIVLYNPLKEDKDYIKHIATIYKGIVVDNSSKPNFSTPELGKMKYLHIGFNSGIAHAQNEGFKYLLTQDSINFFVLFDQDSRYDDDFPLNITHMYCTTQKQIKKLGAIGPTLYEKETQEIYQSAIHKDYYLTSSFILRSEIIASGCCISKEVLLDVGLNDEDLFIDFVDSEWCFRAQAKGYVCGITPHVRLAHKVGLKEIRLGKHIVSVSKPFRYYYQYRNLLILCSRRYVPIKFKINWSLKFLCRFFYLPFCLENGLSTWGYMIKGTIAGIKFLFHHNKY